ncbi:MAG: protein kinase [Bryobacteraceae bacterium]|jgi:Tol biopolymer transport system component
MAELTSEQWAEVKRLFMAAAELRPEELPDYLQRECPDPDLRREVASLLDYSDEGLPSADAAIASAAAAAAREPDPDQRLIGTRLGPYRVEAIAGHGGMGAVYRASRDDSEFRQQVAIKLVRVAAESPDTLRRFRQERQILARLSHPNIARLLDGGSTPEGVPYLVMEFIEGEPITVWCDRQSLGVEDRLRLFLRVCEGVEFAHRDLVVHRDLKPANILVTKDGTPKLLDFGIAKLLDPSAENEAATLTGLVMTPEYASPERVRGEPASVAADVYSLGLILYELLTGKKAQPMTGYTPEAIVRVICQTEPMAPARLKPQLAGDLDSIVRMAIRKEPERRYASAGLLRRDIQRHLERRPVIARPDTIGYRSAKFLRRNRFGVVAGALIAATLAGGLALEYWLGAFARPLRVSQAVQLTQTGRVEIGNGVATDGSRIYFTERTGGEWSLAQVSVNGGIAAPIPVTPPIFQADILDISPDRSKLLVHGGPGDGIDQPLWIVPVTGGTARRIGDVLGGAGTWARDGRSIVFSRGSALYRVNIDGTDGRKLLESREDVLDAIRWAPAPARNILRLTIHDHNTGQGRLWEVGPDGAGLHALLPRPLSTPPLVSDFGGSWIASGKYYLFLRFQSDTVGLWAIRETRSWLPVAGRRPVQIYSTPLAFPSLAPSPDGKRVFFAGGQERRELVRYDARRGQFVTYLSGIAGRWVDCSPDGKWVVYTMAADDTLWRSRPDGAERAPLTPTAMRAGKPHWSPDGTRIVFSGSWAGAPVQVYVVDAIGSGTRAPEAISAAGLTGGEPSWSPDGNSLLFSRGMPKVSALYVMEWKTRKAEILPGSEARWRSAWSPDPRYIAATNTAGSQIFLFDFRTRQWTPLAAGAGLGPPFWSRDGKYVYYQEVYGGIDQPVFRVRIGDRRIERVASSRQLLQSNVTGYVLAGLDAGSAPIASVLRSNSDLYALDLDLP